MEEQTRNIVISMLKEGIPPRDIKSKTGVSGTQIWLIRKIERLPEPKQGRPPASPEFLKRFREMDDAGMPTRKIMEEFSLHSPSSVSHYRKLVGNSARKRGRKPGEEEKTIRLRTIIRKWKQQGMTYQAIADKLKGTITRQRVQQIISTAPIIGNAKCECCNNKSEVLHRHHTNYILDEVEYLCPSCHKKQHKKINPQRD